MQYTTPILCWSKLGFSTLASLNVVATPQGAILVSWMEETEAGLEVLVMTAGSEDHDIAMELLLCLGQALWEKLFDRELREY
jgi:hypothetical protein